MTLSVSIAHIEPCPGLPRRERERAAVAALLAELFPGEEIRLSHTPAGAPVLDGQPYYISISHSRNRVAVALSADCPVGVDIEEESPRVERATGRVTAPGDDPALSALTRWTVKEAVFKAAGIDDATIGEVVVMADNAATLRGRRFVWMSPFEGTAVAAPF